MKNYCARNTSAGCAQISSFLDSCFIQNWKAACWVYLHSEVSRLFGGFRSAMTQMLDEFKNSKPKIWVFRSTWSIMIPISHCFRFSRSVRATYCNSLALFLPVLTPSASQCKALEHITDVLPQSIRMQNSVWCCNPQSGWIHSLVFVCVWLCVLFVRSWH